MGQKSPKKPINVLKDFTKKNFFLAKNFHFGAKK
jgi:hypothetical protein